MQSAQFYLRYRIQVHEFVMKASSKLAAVVWAFSLLAHAEDPVEVHGQATYVRQWMPPFHSPYGGPKSLNADGETGYSFTATVFLGARLAEGTEFYFNPEFVQGVPLSHLQGVGGFANGESQRGAGPSLTLYRARLFLRQTWNLAGEMEEQASEANQVHTRYAAERFVVTAGNVSALDVFDAVDYSRDPRTQFMNWSSLTYGAWDYPADARGYTWGLAGEYISPGWQVRAGRFMMPKESNGLPLDHGILRHYGDVVEFEKPHGFAGMPATTRLLVYRNRVFAGAFDDALAAGTPPDITTVRKSQTKTGFGIGTQVEVTKTLGAYVRAGWSDGKTETFAFTEIDRSLAAGLLAKGASWGRPQDSFGVAAYLNGLSDSHRDYLAAGGQGFFLGDGRLNYANEKIGELFYSVNVIRGTWLTADYQYVMNPGYNRDRGPAQVLNFRAHFEF